MLDFSFTPEQEKLRSQAREFAQRELAPYSIEWDRREELPWDAIKKMARAGYLGLTYPERVGGGGKSYVDHAIVLEEIARASGSCSQILQLQASYPQLIVDQFEELVREIINGEKVLAFAETEDQAGADAGAIQTRAVREGNDYIIDGDKVFISLVPGAQVLMVTALTAPNLGSRGISFFLVDSDQPGVEIKVIPEPGFKAHMLGEVVLTNVKVSANRLIGEENKGIQMMRSRWDYSRGTGGTALIGIAMQALEETVELTKRKRRFGMPLLKWQAVQLRLVDHFSELEAARLLCYKSAWMADNKIRVTKNASMIKTWVAEVVFKTLFDCSILWGGAGFQDFHPMQIRLRDAHSFLLLGGGQDVHKMIIGTEIFGQDYNALRPYKQ
jgi:butyryl-CoA dehydrogenase